VPWPNGRPCKFDCNPGYNWNYAYEKCNLCPPKPPSSEWTSGCKFSCNSGFFGSGMGVCLNCLAYRAYRYEDISTPLHSTWSETSLVCGDTDWVCDTGFTKNENAGGCCPTELPEGGMWEYVDKKTQCNSQNNADHPTCGILCAAGYVWNPQQLTCLGCPNFIENSIRDETAGPCKVRCKPGFWWDETQAACRSIPTSLKVVTPTSPSSTRLPEVRTLVGKIFRQQPQLQVLDASGACVLGQKGYL
jgi:hypothetical protein